MSEENIEVEGKGKEKICEEGFSSQNNASELQASKEKNISSGNPFEETDSDDNDVDDNDVCEAQDVDLLNQTAFSVSDLTHLGLLRPSVFTEVKREILQAFRLGAAFTGPPNAVVGTAVIFLSQSKQLQHTMVEVLPWLYTVGVICNYAPVFSKALRIKAEHAQGIKISGAIFLKATLLYLAYQQLYGGLSGIGANFEPNTMSTEQYSVMVLGHSIVYSLFAAALASLDDIEAHLSDAPWYKSLQKQSAKIPRHTKSIAVSVIAETVLYNLSNVVYSLINQDPSEFTQVYFRTMSAIGVFPLAVLAGVCWHKNWPPMQRRAAEFVAHALSIMASLHVAGSSIFEMIVNTPTLAQKIISQLMILGGAIVTGVGITSLVKLSNNISFERIVPIANSWVVVPAFLALDALSIKKWLMEDTFEDNSSIWIEKLLWTISIPVFVNIWFAGAHYLWRHYADAREALELSSMVRGLSEEGGQLASSQEGSSSSMISASETTALLPATESKPYSQGWFSSCFWRQKSVSVSPSIQAKTSSASNWGFFCSCPNNSF